MATNTPDYVQDRFPGTDPYAPLKDLPTFSLSSDDVVNGEQLKDSLAGEDGLSPHLAWSGLPEGTQSIAVTMFDPDAPTASGFWHWSAFNIPVDVTELPTGAGSKQDLGVGAVTLAGDSGVTAYYGANPPQGHGPHRYLFAVHAVDTVFPEGEIANPTQLGFNLYFHSIGRALIWGWYEVK